jgi:hypothetical protein
VIGFGSGSGCVGGFRVRVRGHSTRPKPDPLPSLSCLESTLRPPHAAALLPLAEARARLRLAKLLLAPRGSSRAPAVDPPPPWPTSSVRCSSSPRSPPRRRASSCSPTPTSRRHTPSSVSSRRRSTCFTAPWASSTRARARPPSGTPGRARAAARQGRRRQRARGGPGQGRRQRRGGRAVERRLGDGHERGVGLRSGGVVGGR